MSFAKSVLFLVLLFVFAGCSIKASTGPSVSGSFNGSSHLKTREPSLTVKSDYGKLPNEIHEHGTGIKLFLPKTTVKSSVTSIPFRVKNTGKHTLMLGTPYSVERYHEGTWYVVPFKQNYGFNAIGILLKPGKTYRESIMVDMLDYRLTEGRYRVVKTISFNRKNYVLAAEFKVLE